MKYLIILSFLLFGLGSQAQAGSQGFVGISYIFGTSPSDFGLTIKLLSDDDENTGVLGAGVSYYPFSDARKFGVDVGVGYLFKNSAVTLGWDFLQKKPQLGFGYIDTEDDSSTPVPPTAPSVPEGGGGGGEGGAT